MNLAFVVDCLHLAILYSITYLFLMPAANIIMRPDTPSKTHSRYNQPTGMMWRRPFDALKGENGCISECMILSRKTWEKVPMSNAPT